MSSSQITPRKTTPETGTPGDGGILAPETESGLARLAAAVEAPSGCAPGVLLIEDDDQDVYLLEEAFKAVDRNIKIYRVKGGLEAIDYLEGRKEFSNRSRFPHPLLVLLDLALPGASGLQVLKHIRSQLHLQTTPVVMLTGSSDVKDAEDVFQLGVSAYLLKPRGTAGFMGIVRNLRLSSLI